MKEIKITSNGIKQAIDDLVDENERLQDKVYKLEDIIKEVREYITSYESIETIQQLDHNENNKDLDYSTIDEMTRRYMIVHDKLLEIIDKVGDNYNVRERGV